MVVDPGCMKCMDCVSVCPKDALYFGFGKLPVAAKATAKRHPKRTWDFTWPEEVALAVVFAGSLWAFRNLYGGVPFLLAIGLGTSDRLTRRQPVHDPTDSQSDHRRTDREQSSRQRGDG